MWADARKRRKGLAKEVKEARCLEIFSAGTVEALRKKHAKDAQDLGLTTELWKEILKADKKYQDAIISGDKDVLEARGAELKKEKKAELKAKRKKKKAELEAKRVAGLRAEGEKCRRFRETVLRMVWFSRILDGNG